MWTFESYNTDFIKNNSDFSYFYGDFQFRINHLKEEKKILVKIFYKQKYIDSFSYEYIKDNFYLKKEKLLKYEVKEIVDFFYKQNFLFIQKRIIQIEKHNYISLWFSCYDKSMKKIFSNEMKYRVTHDKLGKRDKKWWLYLSENKDNEFVSSNQYFVSENWIEKVSDDWKRSFWRENLLSEIKQLNQINEKALYSIYQERNIFWHRLFWTVIILIKELLEFTQTFFWNDYEVDLREIDKNRYGEVEKDLATNYTLYLKVTKKSNSTSWFITILEENKLKDFQREVLEKFPQLLQTYFSKKNYDEYVDLEKQYFSFNIRVKEDWELANLRDVEDVLYHKDDYKSLLIQPTFLTSFVNTKNSLERVFQTEIISSKELYKLEKLKIYYDIFSKKDSFIRKRAKYFLENKNKEIQENNILLYQIDILKEKYGDWNYVLNYKNDQKINFLRENWELLYSFSLNDINPWNTLIYYFNQAEWSICIKWSLDNYILLDLLNFEYSVISFSSQNGYKVILNNSWCNDTLYDLNNSYSPLFRLFKKEIGSSFEYNYNKLSSWRMIYMNSRYHFFHIWVRGYFKLKRMFLELNYSWNNDTSIYQQKAMDFSFFEFLSNKKLTMYYHLFAKGNKTYAENIQIYSNTILKNSHKLGLIIPWRYLWK